MRLMPRERNDIADIYRKVTDVWILYRLNIDDCLMSVRQVCRDDVQLQAEDVFIDIRGTGKLDVPVWNFTICDLQKCAAEHPS